MDEAFSNWNECPPPASEIDQLHFINFGLFSNLLENQCDITLINASVSYNASIFLLFTLSLYNIALSEFISSIVTSLITFSSQLESEPMSLRCIPLISAACPME